MSKTMAYTLDQLRWVRDQVSIAKQTNPHWWRVALAVAAHESDCGSSVLARLHNNFHGIRAIRHQDIAGAMSHRKFESPGASWTSFAYLMGKSSNYTFLQDNWQEARNDAIRQSAERGAILEMAETYCDPKDDPDWDEKVLQWHDLIWVMFPAEAKPL